MAKNEYTVKVFVEKLDGTTVAFEDLTAEEIQNLKANICERLSSSMSRYYTAHPEEYRRHFDDSLANRC